MNVLTYKWQISVVIRLLLLVVHAYVRVYGITLILMYPIRLVDDNVSIVYFVYLIHIDRH